MSKHLPIADVHGPPVGLLDGRVDAFVTSLRASGYAKSTVNRYRQIATSFARWTKQNQLTVQRLDEIQVAVFLREQQRRAPSRTGVKRSALQLLLAHLRAGGEIPPAMQCPSDSLPITQLQERYENYLRLERGLAETTIQHYVVFVRMFLEKCCAEPDSTPSALDQRCVGDFLLDRINAQPTGCMKSLASALRSFLRFLFFKGETAVDLSLSIPRVRVWRQAGVHPFLTVQEVEQVLRSCDLTTPIGRRDHAVLLLLARLGLRGGEVVALNLDNIRWRAGEILVRGKGRVLERLPLLKDVGEALALYIHEDRGPRAFRQVFLRALAPRVPLKSYATIASIARSALERAGLRPAQRGSHLFRYSLGTTMIRQGATMAEISQVLRHRSSDTTEIYAKVDFPSLRGVARSWPSTGGAK